MQVTFVPEICKGDEYEGTVTLKMPTYAERLSLYSCVNTDGEDIRESVKKNGIQIMIEVSKKLPEFVTSVDITRKSDGFKFDSLETMEYDSDMASVISECANRIVGKFSVSNPTIPR